MFSTGLSIVLIGVLALVGWLIHAPALTTWTRGTMPMAPATALLSAAMGASLMLCALRKRGQRCLPGVVINAISLATSSGVLFLRATGRFESFERLGLGASAPFGGAPTGFTSLLAAACFALASIAFLAQVVPGIDRNARLAAALSAAVALIVTGTGSLLTATLGYPVLAGPAHIPIAANTAIVLLVLGIGVAAMGIRLSDRSSRRAPALDGSRRPLAFAFVAVFLLTVVAGYAFYRQEEVEIQREVDTRLEGVRVIPTSDIAAFGTTQAASGLSVRTESIPGSNLSLMAVTSESDLHASLWQRLRWVLLFSTMLLATAAAVLTLVWRNQLAARYREHAALAEGLRLQALRVSELAARSPAVLYTLSVRDGIYVPTDMSPNVERILGYTVAEALEVDWYPAHLLPEDREAALAAPAALATANELANEFRFVRKDGSALWVLNRMTVTRREAGKAVEITGAWHDITERRKAEAALRESEERLRLALASAAQGLWDLNVQTDEAVVSEEYATMLGYNPAEFRETNTAWRERLHPEDREPAAAVYADYIAGRRDSYSTEFRQRTKSGDWKWILSSGKIISRTPDGRPLRMLGTHTDITTRKLAELRSERLAELYEALSKCNFATAQSRSEDELFPQVCEAAAGIRGVGMAWIAITDPSTHLLLRRASVGPGPTPDEFSALGLSADDVPTGHGPTGTAIREGRPCWSLDFLTGPATQRWRREALKFGWVAAGAIPLRCANQVVGALAISATTLAAFDDDCQRLLTEMGTSVSAALDHLAGEQRRAAGEEALRTSEAVLRGTLQEREALLKEVHHRVKNNLQVISSLLRLEQDRHVNATAKSAMGEMQLRIQSMALLHETLYRSQDLAHVDLGAYLGELANQVFRSAAPAGGAVSLQSNLASVLVDMDLAIPCGLLVNEVLSNCFKHGFPDGRAGTVAIDLQAIVGGRSYLLQISDNGVGLPADFAERHATSLGVHLIKVLAQQLKGSLAITGDRGTTFRLTFEPTALLLTKVAS